MLKVCIVGAPPNAEIYYNILKEFADVVAVVENEYEYARKFLETYQIPVYPTPRDVLREKNYDAAVVLVPPSMRYRVLQEILSEGRHVLVEPPVTDNIETALRICNLADYQGVLLAVAYPKRFNPAIVKARELIEGGETGMPISLQSTIYTLEKYPDIFDAFAPEELDVLRFISGVDIAKISVVSAQGGRVYSASIKFINDLTATMHLASQTSCAIEELLINCEAQSLLVDYRNQDLFRLSMLQSDADRELGLQPELKKYRVDIVKEDPMKLIVRNFVEALTKGVKPLTTGYESVRVMESYLAARHSANTEALVRLR